MKRELLFGIHGLESLLKYAPERVVRVWLRPAGRRLHQLADRLKDNGIPVESVDERALERRAGGLRHQGVIAEFIAQATLDEAGLCERIERLDHAALLLVLDEVQDPQNLGACLRSAAAAGADAVAIPKHRAAQLTPAARRAAAGASERMALAVVTNLARTMDRLGNIGLRRLGLVGQATKSLYEADLREPVALVVGGEERGLRRLTTSHCDELLRIPMPGDMESLNVSVAAGIALFEGLRQRRAA